MKTPFKQNRIDHILISKSLFNSVENFAVKPGFRPNNSIFILELTLNLQKR